MYADMIYKFGYVHCDPHAGNVLVRKNEDGVDEIVLLDHGLYTVSQTILIILFWQKILVAYFVEKGWKPNLIRYFKAINWSFRNEEPNGIFC